jgi:hypothetical protein
MVAWKLAAPDWSDVVLQFDKYFDNNADFQELDRHWKVCMHNVTNLNNTLSNLHTLLIGHGTQKLQANVRV